MSRVALIVLAVVALAGGATASGADFTASSYSTASISAAADFNTVVVNLTNPPGTPLTGTVALSATATSDRGVASVKFQYAPTGTTDWVDICTDNVSPYTCNWNTTAIADQTYDVQALATDTAGYSKAAGVGSRVVDNYALTVSLNDPGAMSGTVNLTATASGAQPALQGVKIQQRANGTSTWTDVCGYSATSPRTCPFDTTALADGSRDLRALATDTGGHSAQTAVITRTIDNSPPTATPSIPPSGSGTVTMSATADDTGSGIAYVAWEAYYMGAWYEFCRDTTAPYTCSGDSMTVADGVYPTHIVVMNNAGVKTTSAAQQIIIDNHTPTGVDVQTGNGNTTVGRLQTSDWIRLTWSEPIDPASVVAGWDGSNRAIKVRLAASTDTMDFYDGNDATRLNLVSTAADLKLGGDYVATDSKYDATMSMSGNSITVTLGNPIFGSRNTLVSATTITWKPSAGALDLSGHPTATTLVTESGLADLDF